MQTTERGKMSRIRLNQEYRNKIANRMKIHIEQEDTQEKEKFFQERDRFKGVQDKVCQVLYKFIYANNRKR